MRILKSGLFLLGFCIALSACNTSPTEKALPRSVPEAEGVSSGAILQFLDAVEKSHHEFHSFMFLRHGKVIAEGWWYPYRPDLKHTLYSTSKSFTSTAVGFAVSEKRFSLDDKVISFFPEYLPNSVSPYLKDLTIKNLLTMSAGQDPDPSWAVSSRDSNWIKAFLALPIVNPPGSRFLYNSLATYMAGAIVQKVTGQTLIDYMRPRLFEPLGIEGMDWERDPLGFNTGGWGLRLKTEDMAKFGLLYLRKGNWNGKQILPAEWVEQATSAQILQAPELPQSARDSSDWLQGYGFQFWRCRHNAFRADGAYGQFIIMIPGEDAVIAITAETADMQDEINLVWKYLLPAMHTTALPENKTMLAALKHRLSSLTLPVPEKSFSSPMVAKISGKSFQLQPNEMNLEQIQFAFQDSMCLVTLRTKTQNFPLQFGSGKWLFGETSRLGPNLVLKAKGHFQGLPPSKVAGAFTWKNDHTLELTLRYIESPHTETFRCTFDSYRISMEIIHSQTFSNQGWKVDGIML